VRLFAYSAEGKNKAFMGWKGTTLSETDTVHRLMTERKGKEGRKKGKERKEEGKKIVNEKTWAV
jgi:hypothetical protein